MAQVVKRWVAIASDGELLAFGVTTTGRFERQSLSHSCGSYIKWVSEGAKYCELLCAFAGLVQGGHPKSGLLIQDLPHGRIRECESATK